MKRISLSVVRLRIRTFHASHCTNDGDGHFEHPAGYVDTITMRIITTGYCTNAECFRSLLIVVEDSPFPYLPHCTCAVKMVALKFFFLNFHDCV